MYIYHAFINVLSVHMIHINLNMIFYTHVEHSPSKIVYIKCYTETHTHRERKERETDRQTDRDRERQRDRERE